MNIPTALLEVHQYHGIGYKPLVDYGTWRVAMLRFIDELLPERLASMQRHDETDEVFVLLAGRCILFLGEGSDQVDHIHALDLEPLRIYNVKRSCWHTHALSEEAVVLIIENRDTAGHNSPEIALSDSQKQQILELAGELW
jgi:hypothetical protein